MPVSGEQIENAILFLLKEAKMHNGLQNEPYMPGYIENNLDSYYLSVFA